MRIVLAGSVDSSERTLAALLRHGAQVVAVLGFEPVDRAAVSGFVDLGPLAYAHGIPFFTFRRINDCAAQIASFSPDALFIVGLSQLIDGALLNLPTRGSIGFHPTRLPAGRGRAPLAWMIESRQDGAATFFKLTEGIDDGDILVQVPFRLDEHDDAARLADKVLSALDEALDNWLPRLLAGDVDGHPQDSRRATYFGRRTPEDGLIDWHESAASIARLVRAAARPHPGAFSYLRDDRLIVWRAEPEQELRITGVVGRIVQVDTHGLVVQTGDGLLRVLDWHTDARTEPRVGERFGYRPDIELNELRSRVSLLEQQVARLVAGK